MCSSPSSLPVVYARFRSPSMTAKTKEIHNQNRKLRMSNLAQNRGMGIAANVMRSRYYGVSAFVQRMACGSHHPKSNLPSDWPNARLSGCAVVCVQGRGAYLFVRPAMHFVGCGGWGVGCSADWQGLWLDKTCALRWMECAVGGVLCARANGVKRHGCDR